MSKILLLGASAQLGYDIKHIFKYTDHILTGLIREDFTAGSDTVSDKLSEFKNYDYLINCIAYHKVNECEDNISESFKINTEFVRELAGFCKKSDITFFHISTDYVFDGAKSKAYTETDLTLPMNIYGVSKLAGENLIRAYGEKYFIFRVSSLFGSKPSDDPNINFVNKMIHAAKEGTALKVIDDQIMSPTHARDVAKVIKHFIENKIIDYGIYHGSNSGETSWYNFARTIFELTGLDADISPITYTEFHSKARRPRFCSMDNSRLGQYYKMPHWEDALKEYLQLKGFTKK